MLVSSRGVYSCQRLWWMTLEVLAVMPACWDLGSTLLGQQGMYISISEHNWKFIMVIDRRLLLSHLLGVEQMGGTNSHAIQ